MNDGSERGGAVIEGKVPTVLSRRELSGVDAGFMHESLISRPRHAQKAHNWSV
jgi:hypothetical protein